MRSLHMTCETIDVAVIAMAADDHLAMTTGVEKETGNVHHRILLPMRTGSFFHRNIKYHIDNCNPHKMRHFVRTVITSLPHDINLRHIELMPGNDFASIN